ncbi:hypothetical protein Tco_0996181 [Tanacetum coccineum]
MVLLLAVAVMARRREMWLNLRQSKGTRSLVSCYKDCSACHGASLHMGRFQHSYCGMYNSEGSILSSIRMSDGWAYAFHQDKASLVRVPVANVTLSSSAYLTMRKHRFSLFKPADEVNSSFYAIEVERLTIYEFFSFLLFLLQESL